MEIETHPCPQCERAPKNMKFLNTETGELVRINCKAYCCPFCGIRKAYRLKIALENYLKQFRVLRMWTFTISNRFFTQGTPEQRKKLHARVFQDAWQRFWRDWRRCKMITEDQRSVGYVSVSEFHVSGFVHRHVLVTEFLPVETMRHFWRLSVSRALTEAQIYHTGYTSNVNVVSSMNPKQAAQYVAKYVLKGAQTAGNITLKKRWTRSKGEKLFSNQNERGAWCVVRFTVVGRMESLRTVENSSSSASAILLNLSPFSTTTHEERSNALFLEAELFPPTEFHPEHIGSIKSSKETLDFDWIWDSFGN